jgi:hypothetical protein
MGTDYDDDQPGIRFDDPALCITVEDNQLLVHYLRQLKAVFRRDNFIESRALVRLQY